MAAASLAAALAACGGSGGGAAAALVPPVPPPPADAISPTAPSNLVATVVGDGRIDLSWTAGSDNVGVTGYRIERCEGASCSNFAQIATPAASPYPDTSSLAPSTTYSYRISSVDGAGNTSPAVSFPLATTLAASGGVLQLGALAHDGPATPEQIALILPITGAVSQATTATVRYRPTGSPTWIVGHPLYRIRPELSRTPGVGSVPNAFAWTIIDLQPGTSYDIEVTANDGATTDTKTLTHTTRALPADAPAATVTLPAGSTRAQIQTAISQLLAGQVLQLAAGTYNLDAPLAINTSAGTPASPIYIRGASRSGVVLSHPGRVIRIENASHLVIENMTLQGSGVNSVPLPASDGIQFWDGRASPQTRVTIRNVTMNGVDRAVNASDEVAEVLVYDNTLNGNNTWTPSLIDANTTWNDDGIILPGSGHAAFNNTLRGFGDTFAFAAPSCLVASVGIHFYRNDIRNSGDDLVEVDCGHRNLSFYDNRSHNSMTFISLDPLYGGPFLAARNISINTGRPPYKWNATNSGQFIYNNTVVRTTGKAAVVDNLPQNEAGWIQFDNGDQNSYGYRNNLFVYRGTGTYTLRLGNSGHNPVDFTHNSWYPNRLVLWPQGTFADLAAAYAGLVATTPVFSRIGKRHEQDNITDSDPWAADILLGTDYHTEVTGSYTPALSPGTTPKNSGVIIPNVTDGFNLGAPDRGAIIEGRPVPVYGDRSSP